MLTFDLRQLSSSQILRTREKMLEGAAKGELWKVDSIYLHLPIFDSTRFFRFDQKYKLTNIIITRVWSPQVAPTASTGLFVRVGWNLDACDDDFEWTVLLILCTGCWTRETISRQSFLWVSNYRRIYLMIASLTLGTSSLVGRECFSSPRVRVVGGIWYSARFALVFGYEFQCQWVASKIFSVLLLLAKCHAPMLCLLHPWTSLFRRILDLELAPTRILVASWKPQSCTLLPHTVHE